jgi:integrase/recombinase XerD
MQDITIYQNSGDNIALRQESGKDITLSLPGMAIVDETFLKTWLFGKAEKTQKAYIADIALLYKHTHQSLQQLRLEDLQSFLGTLAHLKPSSQARVTAAIKSVLSFGVKTGYLQFNVGAVIKLPKIENTLAERIMSEQQVARMFALENNPRNHAMLVLLYRVGLRAEELCNLTWAKFQERSEGGQVAVFGKGKKTRFVLIDQDTWNEVMSLRLPDAKSDGYVFRSRQRYVYQHDGEGKPVKDALTGEKIILHDSHNRFDESMVHRIVRSAADRAGVLPGKVSPHWMRHAHATHSLEHGAPITLVQDTLGHADIKTTAKYTHVRPNASSGQYLTV